MFDCTFKHLPDRVFTGASPAYPFASAAVFGAGGRGAEAVSSLLARGVRVLAVADNDPRKHGALFEGLPVIAPAALAALGVPVVVASVYENEIGAQLAGLGLPGVYFYRPAEAAPAFDIVEANAGRIAQAYHALADEDSRAVFLQAVKMLTPKHDGRVKASAYAQYDHPEVRAEAGDVILDVGGMDGETAIFFACRAGGACRVFTFEPSPRHRERILDRVRPHAGAIELVELGAWSHACTLRFNADFSEQNPGCHRVDEDGSDEIRVTDIDSFVRGRCERVDLIKMDIEGAEPQALEGARETIARFSPKLQISVYHEPAHLWEILEFIRGVDPRYRFHMGHHSSMATETILYARV